MTQKFKTQEQVRYLLSKISPLSEKEKKRLKKELSSGMVKIKNKKK